METVKNTELVSQRLGRWYPGDLAFIEALEYRCSRDDEPSELRVTAKFQRRDIVKDGWPADSEPFLKVTILFRGVANLQLKAFGWTAKQISGFDIIDISDRAWEGMRFSVEDYENDEISLVCEEAIVEEAQ